MYFWGEDPKHPTARRFSLEGDGNGNPGHLVPASVGRTIFTIDPQSGRKGTPMFPLFLGVLFWVHLKRLRPTGTFSNARE